MEEVQASTQDTSTSSEVSQSTEQTSQENTQAVETSAASTNQVQADKAAAVAAQAAFAPNYKYKIKDQEKEFDEWIRPVIKNQEIEKSVKELYEKAFGLDEVKASRDSFKTKYEDANTKFSNVEKSINALSSYVSKGDFNSFFDALQIPKQNVVNWLIDELKYQELPPDQKKAIDDQKAFVRQQEQFQSQQSMFQEQLRQVGETQLQMELSRPEISQAAQMFDARAGKQGAFRQEIINRGAYYEMTQGRTVPASELVKELLAFVSPSGQTAVPQQGENPVQTTQSQGVQTQDKKQTMKVFNPGSGSSPVKTQVRSIDDLRRIRAELD